MPPPETNTDRLSSGRKVLAVSARARRGQEWYERVRAAFTAGGLSFDRELLSDNAHEVREFLQRELHAGVHSAVVGGGDGTLSIAADLFEGSSSILGVLPMGTGNAFARDLGIPAHPEQAAQVVLDGHVASVDLGSVNRKRFLNVATIGVSTLIAQNLGDAGKKKLGRLVYLGAVVRALAKVKPFVVKITSEHGIDEFETLQLVLGNGRFHAGPFVLSPNASITEGLLTLYALATRDKAAFLKLAYALPLGMQIQLPEVHGFETAKGRIETRPIRKVTVDGETNLVTPIDYAVLPDVLRVFVPADFKVGFSLSSGV